MLTRRFLMLAAVAGIGLGVNDGATAQPYPGNVIKLIVPFTAGSQPDTIARLIGQQLSVRVGTGRHRKPSELRHRRHIGTQAAASAPPDGHTLLLGTIGSLAIGPALLKSPEYDAIKSFAPVALVSNAPFVLVVGPDVPVKTAHELVAHAKANPGKLNFGAANATPPHLACDLFRRAAAIDIVHVRYRPLPPTLNRSAERRDSDHMRCHDGSASADPGRENKAARGDEHGAVARATRCADGRRDWVARSPRQRLGRHPRAGRYAQSIITSSTPQSTKA